MKKPANRARNWRHSGLIGNVITIKKYLEPVLRVDSVSPEALQIAVRIRDDLDMLETHLRNYRREPDGSIKELKK